MLESSMGCTWINKIGKCKLVNVSEPLERPRIHHLSFVRVKVDEYVDGVPQFMMVLGDLVSHGVLGHVS
jgi:hypothetical protein